MDLGPITRQELDDWCYNMTHPDADNPDFVPRGGGAFQNMIMTSKVGQHLSTEEVPLFLNLIEKKFRYPHAWQPSDEMDLDQFEQKLLSPTKEERDRLRQKQIHEREKKDIPLGQEVREMATGKIGHITAGFGSGEFGVLFEDGSINWVERDGLEVMCRNCGTASNLSCTRCNQAWYCGRDCQLKDWKAHKKFCKKKAAFVNDTQAKDGGMSGNKTGSEGIHTCGLCHKEAKKSCSQCKQVWYCDQICQGKHWRLHKRKCKKSTTSA